MRQPVPKALERDDRWRVALLAQRHDHVAQDGQPGRRSFGLGTTVRVELPGNLGEPVRVGKPVPHQPVQGVGRINGEISLMSRGSADLIGSPIAYTCGSPLF